MRLIELRGNDDAAIGYRNALSRALCGFENYPQLSPNESVKYGEAIARLRETLGEYGDVDAFDDGSLLAPSENVRVVLREYKFHSNKLAEGNLRLIWTAFRISPSLWDFPITDLMDLAGTAQMELLHSAKHYNPWYHLQSGEVPYKTRFPGNFSTFAVKNMHFMMLKAVKDLHEMHIPDWRWTQYKAYWETRTLYSDQQEPVSFDVVVAASEYKRANRRFPTPAELQEYLYHVERDPEAHKRYHKQIRSYAKLLILMQPVSFDALLTGKKQYRDEVSGDVGAVSYTMEGVLPSPGDVPGEVFAAARNEIVHAALQRVTERERQVLELRYGFNGRERNLQEVADFFYVTKERIRQIEHMALRKLRHPSVTRILRDLIED